MSRHSLAINLYLFPGNYVFCQASGNGGKYSSGSQAWTVINPMAEADAPREGSADASAAGRCTDRTSGWLREKWALPLGRRASRGVQRLHWFLAIYSVTLCTGSWGSPSSARLFGPNWWEIASSLPSIHFHRGKRRQRHGDRAGCAPSAGRTQPLRPGEPRKQSLRGQAWLEHLWSSPRL